MLPSTISDLKIILEQNGLPHEIATTIASVGDSDMISLAWLGSDYFFAALNQAFLGFDGSSKEACDLAQKVVKRPQDFQEPRVLEFR